MHNDLHPDDERLAALAGGDADALADRGLADHLTACDRCAPIIEELTLLRGALAALPDLAPSRPLRLIPPVAEPAAPRAGRLEWLRRLAAPAMATGAGLVLVGAIGASGVVNELTMKEADRAALEGTSASVSEHVPHAGSGGSDAAGPELSTDSSFGRTDEPRGQTDGVDNSTQATPSPAAEVGPVAYDPRSEQPWLTVLIAGVGLFGVAAALRYSLTPRAG